jgi:hypothetical protein
MDDQPHTRAHIGSSATVHGGFTAEASTSFEGIIAFYIA